MSFVSVAFAVLFAVTFVSVLLCKTSRQSHIVLLIASYCFYAYWDVRFLALLIFQTFVGYYFALKIGDDAENRGKREKRLLAAGVGISLAVLGFFKYLNFFIESFYGAFNISGAPLLNIILPVGISFFTFQSLSYIIDVYRGELKARKSFMKVSLYIAFFPQLVAGPIVRAQTFLPQLDEDKKVTKDNIVSGGQIFLFGLIKKIVIADRLAVCVDSVFAAPAAYSSASLIVAVFAYSIQIYCDFSGYTDMAIGVAKVFGYDLCENFNLPYLSKGVPEFWRRWHISLGSWFRDYLFYPVVRSKWCQSMGKKSKKKFGKTFSRLLPPVIGNLITWFATGLWHGASWTFVAWGMYYGVLIILSLVLDKPLKKLSKAIHFGEGGVFDVIRIVRTYFLVCLGYIFFRAQTFGDAFLIIKRIFTGAAGINYLFVYAFIYFVIVFACQIFAYVRNNQNGYYCSLDLTKFSSKLIINIVLLVVLAFAYFGDTAFIYFQF